MSIDESFRLERYKLVTSRQVWVKDVARAVFTGYAATLAAFVGGAITLTFATNAVARLGATTVNEILFFIAVFLSCVAIASVYQIRFCIWRWYEYRGAECKLYAAAPQPESWAKYFELSFIVIISASVALVWLGYRELGELIHTIPDQPVAVSCLH